MARATEFPGDPNEQELADARSLLAQGLPVRVGCCYLGPDADLDMIWGDDSYGNLGFASNDRSPDAIERALKWAVFDNARED